MNITNIAIQKRTTIFVLIAMILISGLYFYITLPRESTPDIPVPYIIVTTTYTGVSPADMENTVTVPIEKKLKGLHDVEEIRSVSAEGISTISIEFLPEVDIDDALQKVRDKVDQAQADLPEDADDPIITEVSFSDFPIMIVNVSGDVGLVRLKAVADELEERIEAVPGVLDASVIGGLEREIRIEPDPERLAAYEIPLGELLALIGSENENVAAGNIDLPEAKFQVRVPGEFQDPKEAQNLILMVRDGNPIYLTDVAQIRDTFKDSESYSRINGRESVAISIQKRTGENALRITKQIKHILSEDRSQVPHGIDLTVSMDESKYVLMMVSDLENNILSGLVLVLAIIFISMGLRNAFFVALAIPLSMLISFIVLRVFGMTLNNVVLFSLILALGMLVDNAIVIVENCYRHMQEGKGRLEAAREGTTEVALPVIVSTVTTLCAFLPMLFWPGIMGEFMSYLPKTLIITLSASLFVALVINPVFASRFMKVRKLRDVKRLKKEGGLLTYYSRFLNFSLDRPGMLLIICGLVLLATVVGYRKFGHGIQFFPDADPDRAMVYIRGPEGTSLNKSDEITRVIEQKLAKYEDIENYVANVGSRPGGFFGGGSSGSHVARISIDFKEAEDRRESSRWVLQQIRQDMKGIAGAEIQVEEERHGPPQDPPINIEISGEEFDVLAGISQDVKRHIQNVPGLVDLKDDYEQARPELRFQVDRQRAALLDVDTVTIANYVKAAVMGRKVGNFRQGEDEYDITVRLAPQDRDNLQKVLRLNVPGPRGEPIPLSSLARVDYAGGLGSITRIDQKRVITLDSEVEGRLPNDALADVKRILSSYQTPVGYGIAFTGQDTQQKEASDFLIKAFVVALFLILLVLITQFNSLILPSIIMVSVILSLAGVLIGLLVVGIPFGIVMTGIGVISLAGVVVNNAIVLIDYVQLLRARGLARRDALVQAGIVRLRPVLLTAVTTILGLIPMATGISFNFREFRLVLESESSQWWGPMAIAVIFGLAFATLLTLVVVPTMYELLDSLVERMRTKTSEPVEQVVDSN
ncbi:MAG: efflux RND transporter permease subunit [Candidatus Abyssobacteria bacterium SURF_5]|uniref:Efflux RND transporter permease subunit n=1 Tax=Abyssobacteria bacterium (strain SURF_5) TaxID=2093360 RepID=A0A3A4NP05_ABYX5|nr:MAG: efflux RND transporter permease subunit [Candidatus Abyssubacteria bacterium SURF_5]